MKSVSWKDVAELIGISAILVSLIFVVLQLNQAEVIARSEMRLALLENQIEVNNAIIAHPDIWVRGNAGEELEPADAAVFSRQVVNVNDWFWSDVQYARLMGLDWEDSDLSEYASYLYENPGAKRVWRDREESLKRYRGLGDPGEQFTSDWIDAIESKLELFDRALGH